MSTVVYKTYHMDYNEAIATLEGDVLEAVTNHVAKLTKGDQKVKGLLKTLGVTLGLDSDTDSLETLKKAAAELTSLKSELADKETQLTKVSTELNQVKHDTLISTACQTSGFNRKVLESLPGFDPSKLKVSGNQVTYSEKPLIEAVDSDEIWSLFKPALVTQKTEVKPETPEKQPENPKLPVGGGSPASVTTALTDWVNKRYTVPKLEAK